MSPSEKRFSVAGDWNFDNSYAGLPESLFVRLDPVPVRAPRLLLFNDRLASYLGLDVNALQSEEGVSILAGNRVPKGSDPIAQAYAGHQFGHFTMLGDGRAILLGEQITPSRERYDIQLKGSGRTPFSRGGDGRAALGPILREYIVSEGMHALGVPTTRSLAVVTTGERVLRETLLPGAILTRVAQGYIRVGTFEYVAARGNTEHLHVLAEHALCRYFPESCHSSSPALALLDAVVESQAALVSKWMLVGFIHGVMNTDNMSLSGETIDYGPCAFMDEYDPSTAFSSIDHSGRYAYSNQPKIAAWNLARFAETLLPLLHSDMDEAVRLAQERVEAFLPKFQSKWLNGMRAKLGVLSGASEDAEDLELIETLLKLMHLHRADFTNTFRALSDDRFPDEPFLRLPAFGQWHARWQSRLTRQPGQLDDAIALMRRSNPAVIARNHLVEEALAAAVDRSDLEPVDRLIEALSKPHEASSVDAKYCSPPSPSERVHKTFCGT